MLFALRARLVYPLLPILAAGLFAAGCQDSNAPAPGATTGKTDAGKGDGHDEGHHHHHGEKGARGGALVAIGDDAAHLEVVLDAATGKVTAYVLDGAAQNPVPIKAETLELAITVEHAHEHDHDHDEGEADAKKEEKHDESELPELATLVLKAIEPDADGTTSVFAGEAAGLKGAESFDAVLTAISIDGKEYKNVEFNYPEGNEHDHHHH